ncbi:MAG: site-specific DNA-methyltransferase [Nitrosopumilaceae archaeon]|nr:site-specific DNA-methyltransferase [Nitrosopumilaceae archaeon]
MNSKIQKIICDDSQNITKWHKENNVALSIIKPPYITDEELNDKYLTDFQNIMKQVSQVTKPEGICCLILDEDKNSYEKMSSVSSKILLQVMDSEDWEKREEIIWVKSPKSSIESINPMENGILINFEDTPFSTVHVLQKTGCEFEYVDGEERISKLDVDDKTKEEWSNSVWFVKPKKESEFQDRIASKIISRLIQIFTYKNNIVLDPFAGHGIVGKITVELSRKYICFEKNEIKIPVKTDEGGEMNLD